MINLPLSKQPLNFLSAETNFFLTCTFIRYRFALLETLVCWLTNINSGVSSVHCQKKRPAPQIQERLADHHQCPLVLQLLSLFYFIYFADFIKISKREINWHCSLVANTDHKEVPWNKRRVIEKVLEVHFKISRSFHSHDNPKFSNVGVRHNISGSSDFSASLFINSTVQTTLTFLYDNQTLQLNCKERTTCTNSSEVKPDLCEDQDQQCSVQYKSKWKADRTAKVNFNAQYFG